MRDGKIKNAHGEKHQQPKLRFLVEAQNGAVYGNPLKMSDRGAQLSHLSVIPRLQ